MSSLDVLVAVAIVVGLVGVIVPVVPGTLMVGAVIAVWAGVERVWWLLALVLVISAVAVTLKFVVPARAAKQAASTSALVAGALGALVGFFVIPVIGMVIGFLVGVLGAEFARRKALQPAWAATWATTKSVGLAMLVELVAVIMMAGLWVGALVTR